MEIVYKKVNDLIPYINNSRTHSEEQVNQIVASINEFGFTNPLLIDEKDNIIAGHSENSGCHWFDKSQWSFPTKDVYNSWANYCKNNNINAFKKEYEEIKKEYEEIKKEYYSTRAYFDNTHDNMNNVWHFNKTSGEERESAGGHATPKPIALCSRAIKSSSRENEIVLDVFGGSGSTLIACEQLNRSAYLMELEPKWVDVIIQRWEEFTGKKAIKLN